MKIFRLFPAVIVVQTLTLVAQSLAVHGWNALLRSKRLVTSNNSTCSTQQLKSLVDGAILKSPQEGNYSSFHHGDKVEFVCKDGYQQVGQLKSYICQGDGKWEESSPNRSGFCAKTDEVSCGPIVSDVTGRATGILTSTTINRHLPNATVYCTWKLVTKDPGFYIKLLFVNFSLSPNCTDNFISLEDVSFTDFSRTKKCCSNSQSEDVCRFGGEISPPLCRSVSQTITVKFYSNDLTKSFFKAIWYNVNGLYPNGLVPKRDPTYAPQIVFPTPSKTTNAPDTPSVLALTVFALILFAVGVVIACKFGRRYLGPSCSFGHFWALVSCRWASRAPSTPRRSQEVPPEARGLMTDTDSPFTGERRIRILEPNRSYPGDESSGPSHDSSEHIA